MNAIAAIDISTVKQCYPSELNHPKLGEAMGMTHHGC